MTEKQTSKDPINYPQPEATDYITDAVDLEPDRPSTVAQLQNNISYTIFRIHLALKICHRIQADPELSIFQRLIQPRSITATLNSARPSHSNHVLPEHTASLFLHLFCHVPKNQKLTNFTSTHMRKAASKGQRRIPETLYPMYLQSFVKDIKYQTQNHNCCTQMDPTNSFLKIANILTPSTYNYKSDIYMKHVLSTCSPK